MTADSWLELNSVFTILGNQKLLKYDKFSKTTKIAYKTSGLQSNVTKI